MNKEELYFIDFCIFSIAEKTGKSVVDIYKLLSERTNLINEYLIPCYDVLHTQGKDYIVSEIIEGLRNRGIVI